MTARLFREGDTVRILRTHPDDILHGMTGEVLGYACSGAYALVRVTPHSTELLLDSELELVQ